MPPKKRVLNDDSPKNASNMLSGCVVALSGSTFTQSQGELVSLLESIGAQTAKTYSAKVTHVLTTQADYNKGSVTIKKALDAGIFVVSEDFLHESLTAGKKVKESEYALSKKKVDESDSESSSEEEQAKPKATRGKKAAAAKKQVVQPDSDSESSDESSSSDEEAKRSKKKQKPATTSTTSTTSTTTIPKKTKKELDDEVKENLLLAEKLADLDSDLDSDSDSDSDSDDGSKTKIQIKGRAAVDINFPRNSDFHVYDDGKDVYDATLNQTEIAQNNNKFYIVQLLQSDNNANQFVVWTRWGREGKVGQSKPFDHYSLSGAKSDFYKKFYEKTSNQFDNRHHFVKKSGKYDLLEMDYSVKDAEEPKKKKKPVVHKTECSLDDRVQNFIKLIFDVKMMKQTLVEAKFDLKKSPLGKLHKNQITKGYQVLKDIETEINGKCRRDQLQSLSSRFYTLIPHDFGFNVPPYIDTISHLKDKINMLASLADIEIATTLIKDSADDDSNLLEAYYKQLKSDIKPLDKSTDTYKNLVKYAMDSHDTSYFRFGLSVDDIYSVDREGEAPRFDPWKKNDNKLLLWHGSRLTNWCGIISQGLKIAPPEAPKTGYRFGKGIYFADCISKSASYCGTSRDKPTAIMILCEVALGNMNELDHDTYMEKAPAGTHSTKARGMSHPDPNGKFPIEQGLHIPGGKIVKSGLNTSCSHNEFIVYDIDQVKIRYILKVHVKN
ncbi:poly(ADP-ribosyl)transferase [Cavenderia fasciculata]|uniref:Poly [ADP-ribose] polymerase n=1 Tax=Cavenderia fasciculata TaxID=261658 RepID=F4Q6M1_CACFS|nr:poly(ADP-ribosyl)transferase [Cavenderia fasciculata]EGG16531.1 poly(ADP-ribosyl)transferase [Cavenderia fasciculata]|eukprot:XP_004354931.1 poly(ADP-ribosyl)transferase [Cavenderia fasciculata]